MTAPRYDYIRIGLPISLSLVGTIGDLVDKAWPGATIITDPQKAGVPREFWAGWTSGEMLLQVDVSKAAKRVSKKAAREAVDRNATAEGDPEGKFHGWGEDGTVNLSAPEELTLALEPLVAAILEDDAVINYLSWTIRGRHDTPLAGKQAFISVARSDGQTPHECHMREKARADQLAELLNEASSFIESSAAPEDLWPRIAAALGEDPDE